MVNRIKYIKGSSQENRFPEALHNDYFKIDEREFNDLVAQSAKFSKFLKYYNEGNNQDNDWQAFFESVYDKNGLNTENIKKMEDDGNMPPHLALLFAFLKLFKREQDNLNTLTRRHLDYYYKDILGFNRATGCAGKVPVFFELNKNAKSALVPKGTILIAGNDENGKLIKYKSAEDIVVNQAVVADYYSENSDTDSDSVSTIKFNELSKNKVSNDTICGFALSSPIFKRVDGKLEITTGIQNIEGTFKVEYTSATGWETASIENNKIFINANKSQLIAQYNKKTHEKYGPFETTDPVFVFTTIKKDVEIPEIKKLNLIKLDVKGSTELLISNLEGIKENKTGTELFGLNCAKGTMCQIIVTDEQKKQGIQSLNNIEVETTNKTYKPQNNKITLTEEDGLSKYLTETNKYNKNVQEILNEENGKSESEKAKKLKNIAHLIPKLTIPTLTKAITADFTVSDNNVKCFAFAPHNVTSLTSKNNIDDVIKEYLKQHSKSKSGYLYVGLDKVQGDTVVNLFFRLEDSKKDEDTKTNMYWEYLCGNTWEEYKIGETIVKDTTSNFQQSGIIGFKICEETLQRHTIMPEDKVWIRMKYSEDKYPKVIDIKAQAVEAEYDETSEGKPSIGECLAKETIKKLYTSISGVKKVVQPYPGFEGEYEEEEKHFYNRVSERLRHKNRAVTSWDYERLVLQKFPSIAEVICLNCSDNGEYNPGYVTLVVLPDLSKTKQENSLKPNVDPIVLQKIESEFIKMKSPFVTLRVRNAEYSEVKVDCELSLKNGYDDEAYYTKLIIEQIRNYIAPWYDKGNTITRNDNHNVSKILYFIETLPYVNHIKKLVVMVNNEIIDSSGDFGPSSQLEILTSAPTHTIKIVKDEQ